MQNLQTEARARDLELRNEQMISSYAKLEQYYDEVLKDQAKAVELIADLREKLGIETGAKRVLEVENIELRRELRESLKIERDLLGRMSNRLGLPTDEQTAALTTGTVPTGVGGRTTPWPQQAARIERSIRAAASTPEADERASHWTKRIEEIEKADALGKPQESAEPSDGTASS